MRLLQNFDHVAKGMDVWNYSKKKLFEAEGLADMLM